MSQIKYRTIEDVQGIVPIGLPEGLTLEYKGSDVIAKYQQATICKGVSAFANSVGGQFIIGIKTKDFRPVELDSGVSDSRARDWIFQVVNASTSPTIESLEVFEIVGPTGSYYVIDVPRSEHAPHQFDGRYYKRRGPHSEPMEHYEIEDVRNRPKKASTPLLLDVVVRQEVMFLLQVKNDHANQPVTNAKFQFEFNFDLNRSGLNTLTQRGLRSLRPGSELFFNLDSAISILQESPDAEITVHATYEFMGNNVSDSFTFHLGDYNHSAVITSDELNLKKRLIDAVRDLGKEVERLRRDSEYMRAVVDGTGLRISQRSLSAFRNQEAKFDPEEFGAAGYRLILDISQSEARLLESVFRFGGGKEAYDELPKDLRDKFETRFKLGK